MFNTFNATIPKEESHKYFSNIDFSNIQEKLIDSSQITNSGTNWSVHPIRETCGDTNHVVGWQLHFTPISIKNISSPNRSTTIFITPRIIEVDILSSSTITIFRTHGSKYYKVRQINEHFKNNGWWPWASNLLHQKLVARASTENITKASSSHFHKNSIEYIKPVFYNIQTYEDPSSPTPELLIDTQLD